MIRSPTSIISPGFACYALQMLQRVQQGFSPAELVYTAHEHWPLRPGRTTHTSPTLRISVLDSSFNPPTLAHLALANSSPPSSSQHASSTPAPVEPYDARMLLLSVRNADKALKLGDATFVQRLEMMRLLSHDIGSMDAAESSDNVAVAVIDEPTFVGKSAVLLHFLQARLAAVVDASHAVPSARLTFVLGFDTLVRLFSPKYYSSEHVMFQMLRAFLSPDQDDCRILCAYRRTGSSETVHDKTLGVAREFITSDRIAFVDIGTMEQTYSSSQVRAGVAAGDEKWKQLVTGVISDYIIGQDLYSEGKLR